MLEETEVMPSALLGRQQLAGGLGNRDIGSSGPTPEGASDVHGETDHFSGRAAGSGHVVIASTCTLKPQVHGDRRYGLVLDRRTCSAQDLARLKSGELLPGSKRDYRADQQSSSGRS